MSNSNNVNTKKNDTVLNNKKILCFNMLNNKKCNYGNKCVYAHSLSDQKIDSLRHKAYTIIKSAENLSHIDLLVDQKLYDTLVQLTKMCSLCNKNLCPGGYNCRNGAINMKSKVCYEDFMFGNCKRNNCLATHLTTRGFIPYNKQKNNYKNEQLMKEQLIERRINILNKEFESLLLKARKINKKILTVRKDVIIHGFENLYKQQKFEDILALAKKLDPQILLNNKELKDFIDIALLKVEGFD